MIYLFLADGFEEVEALFPLDILRRAGADVKTVSVTGHEYVTGSHGITVKADITDEKFDENNITAVILPGGMPGTTSLDASKTVHRALEKASEDGKIIGAICAAPSVLGKAGLLKGKEAICYPGFEKYLSGAKISDKKVVRDGNIITAAGAGVAREFGFALTAALFSPDAAEKIAKAIIS